MTSRSPSILLFSEINLLHPMTVPFPLITLLICVPFAIDLK